MIGAAVRRVLEREVVRSNFGDEASSIPIWEIVSLVMPQITNISFANTGLGSEKAICLCLGMRKYCPRTEYSVEA
jgi:hypothetical protein